MIEINLHLLRSIVEICAALEEINRFNFEKAARILSQNSHVRRMAHRHRDRLFRFLTHNREELLALRQCWELTKNYRSSIDKN